MRKDDHVVRRERAGGVVMMACDDCGRLEMSDVEMVRPVRHICQKAEGVLASDRCTYRWEKRLLTRFSSDSTTLMRVVSPMTAIGALRAWAISNRLYRRVCRGWFVKRSNSSRMKRMDLVVLDCWSFGEAWGDDGPMVSEGCDRRARRDESVSA